MQNSSIRKATTEDLNEVQSIFVSAMNNMNSQGIFQWDEVYPDRKILKEDIEKNQMYIYESDNKILAAYVLNKEFDVQYNNAVWNFPDSDFLIVHRLCVNPEFQNMGIGNNLMEYIENQVVSYGKDSIRLDAFSENPFALRLYENLGYVKTGYADWRKGRFYLYEKILYN